MSRFIYLVAKGEHGEGQTPEGAYSTLQAAKEAALRLFEVWPTQVASRFEWRASINGCDEVWIYRLRVLDR